jgi:hypothetical protein
MTIALAALLAFFVTISPIVSAISVGVNTIAVTDKVAVDVHAAVLAHRQKKKVAVVAPVASVPVIAAPAPKESASERAACSPDAFRFCLGHAIFGHRGETLNCLIANKQKLSKICRDVLTSHGL